MSDPATKLPNYNIFEIRSTTAECLEAPADPAKDPCKIQAEEVESGLSISLERKNGTFQLASADTAKLLKVYPNYRAPAAELAEYLAVKAEFSKVFGDEQNPSDIFKKISIVFEGKEVPDKNRAIFNWFNITTNFISHGQLDPKHLKMKNLQETTIKVGAFAFADPVLGTMVEKVLKGLKDNSKLSSESRKRVEWLLGIYATREKFWAAMKPAMDKSQSVSDQLKPRSVDLLIVLFANHVLAEKGYASYLYSDEVKGAAKVYHDIFSKIDPSYNASKNYYAFMKDSVSSLRSVDLPEAAKKELLLRIAFLENEYGKAAQKEMIDLLAAQPAETAYREYLEIKYGDTPARAGALKVILSGLTLKTGEAGTSHSFAMDKISRELRLWVDGKTGDQRKEALEAINHLLKVLFEKDGKMEVFWDKQVQTTDNFYKTGNFSILSNNKKALEDLIVWARNAATEEKLRLSPDNTPHVALRKWSLGTEIGLGVAGLGAGAILAFAPIKDQNAQYFTQGGSIILGSSALGAAGGNLLSYKLNVTKNTWLFDVGGAVVGGLLGGLIYGLATPPPPAFGGGNNGNPGQRFPVDGYGP